MKSSLMKRKEVSTIGSEQAPSRVAKVDFLDFLKVDLKIYLETCLEIYLAEASQIRDQPIDQSRELISSK